MWGRGLAPFCGATKRAGQRDLWLSYPFDRKNPSAFPAMLWPNPLIKARPAKKRAGRVRASLGTRGARSGT